MIGRERAGSGAVRTAVILLFVCLLFVAPAAGHAYLAESTPGEGERLEELPAAVELRFAGDGIELAEITVTDPDGADVSGEAAVDPDDRRVVTAPLEGDGDGVYVVEWEVLADDGHTTTGTYLFVVGEGELDRDQLLAVQDDGDDDVSWLEAAAKGLVLLSVVGLVGVPVTLWVAVYPVFGSVGRGNDALGDRRVKRLLAGAAVALLAGVVTLGFVQATSVGASPTRASLEAYLGTTLGRAWLGQVAVAAGVAGVLAVSTRRDLPRRYWLGAAVAGGLAVQLAIGWTSHSATMIARLEGAAVDVAHVGSAALWVGGLAALALAVPPLLERVPADRRARVAGTVVARFSIVALTGVTVGLTTGLLLAAWHVPDLAALESTLYGTALSAKTALVALALGLGGVTRFVLLRRLRTADGDGPAASGRPISSDGGRGDEPTDPTVGSVVRAIRLEVAILVLVVVLSGVITSVPTAAVAGDDAHEPAVLERGDGDLDVIVTVVPSFEAHDRAHVEEGEPVVFDVSLERGGERVSADDGVDLFVRNERHGTDFQVRLEETDDGTYSTVQSLPEPEWWDVRATAWVDGDHASEWVGVYAIPEGHAHADHDHDQQGAPDGPFAVWLQLGAVVVGLLGTVAVVLETLRFDRHVRDG
ncbi:copper resistance CopC/CopD family protein [Natrononativus amylolyticus]|uniref:copper resistance CopC/CopD family protein n=1 Tax=Natrononativus amylolyticus TaxID=2963434 RepID=UPI0020CCD610|nr:copper resistance protein CopC [Natrononativus amylolyticus]